MMMDGSFRSMKSFRILTFCTFLIQQVLSASTLLGMQVSALQASYLLVSISYFIGHVFICSFLSDLTPSSLFPVSYNLSYACPEGMVFNDDWFATPAVMLTCQVKEFYFSFFIMDVALSIGLCSAMKENILFAEQGLQG